METNMDSSSDRDLEKPETLQRFGISRIVYVPPIADVAAPDIKGIEASTSVDLSCYLAAEDPAEPRGYDGMGAPLYDHQSGLEQRDIQVFDPSGELIGLVTGIYATRAHGAVEWCLAADWTEIPRTWQSMGGDQA